MRFDIVLYHLIYFFLLADDLLRFYLGKSRQGPVQIVNGTEIGLAHSTVLVHEPIQKRDIGVFRPCICWTGIETKGNQSDKEDFSYG